MTSTNPKHKDQVAKRAYEIWQSQGSPHGQDQEHWLLAERELTGGGESKPKRKARRASEGPSAARRTLKAKSKATGRKAKTPKT